MTIEDAPVRIDPFRRSQWLVPSGARIVDLDVVRYLLPVRPGEPWERGDLFLGQVIGPPGLVKHVQNVNRAEGISYRDAALYPGSVTVALLSPRAGTSTCIAHLPGVQMPEIDLHGVGGHAGLVEPGSGHTTLYRETPTRLRVVGLLGDAEQRPLNLSRFGIPVSAERRPRGPQDPRIVLVVGSDMDDGKTTTARRLIYCLRAAGRPVVAGKAVGIGSVGDIASMFDAGAEEVFDFTSLGEPATIGLPHERVIDIFHQVTNHLRGRVGPEGYVVVELADGVWYRETRMVLEAPSVAELVTDVVFACHGVLDAENGVARLTAWGYRDRLRALSGRLGSSGALRRMVPELVDPNLPVFDALDYEEPPLEVARLLGVTYGT
jgi:hypothetical protein